MEDSVTFLMEKGVFLSLKLMDTGKNIISDNFYWLPNEAGKYEGLTQIKSAKAVSRLYPCSAMDFIKNSGFGFANS